MEERYKKEPLNTVYFAEYLSLVSNTCLDFQKDLDEIKLKIKDRTKSYGIGQGIS